MLINNATCQRETLSERPIRQPLNECSNALRDMPNNPTPGTDSLSTEFYKFFFKDISKNLLDSLIFLFVMVNRLPIKEGELLVLFRSRIKILLFWKIGDQSHFWILTMKFSQSVSLVVWKLCYHILFIVTKLVFSLEDILVHPWLRALRLHG